MRKLFLTIAIATLMLGPAGAAVAADVAPAACACTGDKCK